MTDRMPENRLRNTRAWAAARVGQMSGAEVIVSAIDELLELRDFTTPPTPYEFLGDSGQVHCPFCAGEGRITPPADQPAGDE